MSPEMPDPGPWDDLIVDEIRAVREAHARRFDYDLTAIVADLQDFENEERKRGQAIVTRPPKRVHAADEPAS